MNRRFSPRAFWALARTQNKIIYGRGLRWNSTKESPRKNVRLLPFGGVGLVAISILMADDNNPPTKTKVPSSIHEYSSPQEASRAALFPLWSRLLEEVVLVEYSEARDANTILSDSGKNKPSGLKGLACKHCVVEGKALDNSRAIFPQDRRSLVRDIQSKLYPHLLECPLCPSQTKDDLVRLQNEQGEGFFLEGAQLDPREERLLFKDLWYRMGHKDMQSWKMGH